MIVDTSALLAVLIDEPEATSFMAAINGAMLASVSAGSWIELHAVLVRRFLPQADKLLDTLGRELRLAIEPVTIEQARIGAAAYRRFGIGTRHPAQLNLGDCFAYALAKATGEPLLFKGNDFSHTDVVPALPSPLS